MRALSHVEKILPKRIIPLKVLAADYGRLAKKCERQ